MRWSRFLPICACICLIATLYSQSVPDFNQAVDPVSLDPANIFEQLDTVKMHRTPINLSYLSNEFPGQKSLMIETYYQKSAKHHLLRLSKNLISPERFFAMAEGWGTTYFRISDGNCIIVSTILQGKNQNESADLHRNCIY